MNIRRRLFFTYLILIILFILYSLFMFYMSRLRNTMDSHITAVYKVKNIWNEILIAMNNIPVHWDNGKSYDTFQEKESAFQNELDILAATIQTYFLYPGSLKNHLTNLKRIWSEARISLANVTKGINNPDFKLAVKQLETKSGLQRLNHLWNELSALNTLDDIKKAHAVKKVIDAVEFFPIYGETFIRLYNTIIESISRIYDNNIRLQNKISTGFFIVFLITFLFSSLLFTHSIVKMYYDIKVLPETGRGYINEIITIYPSEDHGPCKRTAGHYHTNTSFEIHYVLKEEVIFLLQKYNNNGPGWMPVVYSLKAKEGDWLIIPSDYGHTFFNTSNREAQVYNYIAPGAVLENRTLSRKKSPQYIIANTKDGLVFRQNSIQNYNHPIQLPRTMMPVDFFREFLEKDNQNTHRCYQLYDWIKKAGISDALHGYLDVLKKYISFQFLIVTGPPRAARICCITQEGKLYDSPEIFDITGSSKEPPEFNSKRPPELPGKWLDVNIPLKIAVSENGHTMHPYVERLFKPAVNRNIIRYFGCSRLYRALLFFIRNYKENFKVADLANEVYYSENHCKKWFKEQTHKSIIKFRNDMRIEKAKEELTRGSSAIQRIAYDLGFCNQSAFNNIFKTKTGSTPDEYRKKYGL